jgi:tRNA A-37 threonylcarbamoyl transferase component Bud32
MEVYLCPPLVSAHRGGGRAMQGPLGEKIGEGAFAKVYAWAPGQVVKLFNDGLPRRIAWEARMTRVAFAAGLPAPEMFGEVTLEGRFGIVMSRLDGPTLTQLLKAGAITSLQAGAILATLAMSIHKTPPPPEVLFLRDWMDHSLRGSGDKMPKHIATGILTLIERLSPMDGLCHCDLHPGNVIMTADGPRLVDWLGLVRAPAALDLAVSHMLLSEILPEFVDDPERPRALNAAVQLEYARLAGMSQAALTAAVQPYLPIVCVFALLGGVWPGQRERLIQRVEAALRP